MNQEESLASSSAAGSSRIPLSLASEAVDDDWEEWDGRSPFWIHCVAGSLAGVTEHTLVYPLDTVRTHIQVCASCIHRGVIANKATPIVKDASLLRSALKPAAGAQVGHLPMGMWQTIRHLVNEPVVAASAVVDLQQLHQHQQRVTAAAVTEVQGFSRLWKGVQTMFIGCIPAHALYFSSYELVKNTVGDGGPVTPFTSSLAGAAAVCSHDIIMTPLDTMKQRIQLGHYNGSVRSAFTQIVQQEGWMALYRSFPITLAANIPYGMVMVSTHEFFKQVWADPSVPAWQTVLAASSMAGFVASAITTPLDRIKTDLQTQQLTPACGATTPSQGCPRVVHSTWQDAASTILRNEGTAGFFRGAVPRVLSHTPAVAISWTAYETLKNYLMVNYGSS